MQGRAIATIAAGMALGLSLALTATPGVAAEFASHLQGDSVLVLAEGERVTLRLAPDGKLVIVGIQVASLADAAPPRPAAHAPDKGNPFIKTPEGTIAFTLAAGEEAGLLKVENGGSLAFDYQAWIPQPGGRLEPTNVCTVLPLLAGYEQWPRRHLSRLVLDRFTPRATNAVDCPQPVGPPPAVPTP